MTTLAIFSTLMGSVLGLRFRFLILLPVIGLGFIVLAAAAIVQDMTVLQLIKSTVVFGSFLQLGYVLAAFRRHAGTVVDAASRWSQLGTVRQP